MWRNSSRTTTSGAGFGQKTEDPGLRFGVRSRIRCAACRATHREHSVVDRQGRCGDGLAFRLSFRQALRVRLGLHLRCRRGVRRLCRNCSRTTTSGAGSGQKTEDPGLGLGERSRTRCAACWATHRKHSVEDRQGRCGEIRLSTIGREPLMATLAEQFMTLHMMWPLLERAGPLTVKSA